MGLHQGVPRRTEEDSAPTLEVHTVLLGTERVHTVPAHTVRAHMVRVHSDQEHQEEPVATEVMVGCPQT